MVFQITRLIQARRVVTLPFTPSYLTLAFTFGCGFLRSCIYMVSVLRGGAKPPKKNVANALTAAVADVTPTTRMYLLGCLACATLSLLGIPEVSQRLERQREKERT